MKVFLIREKKHAEFNDSYAARLFEQGKAVPAKSFRGDDAKYWLNQLKIGMEQAEADERSESDSAEDSGTKAKEKVKKRPKGDGK